VRNVMAAIMPARLARSAPAATCATANGPAPAGNATRP